MTSLAHLVRRPWILVAGLLGLGVLAAVLVLAAVSDPASSPSGGSADVAGTPAAATASPTPGAEPSSGPTGTPTPGSLDVVPAGERRTDRAVPFDRPAEFQGGLRLSVTGMEAVSGVARGPGEIAGPAVRLSFELRNGTGEELSLESVVLSASYGAADTPAVTLSGPGAVDFGGTLAPGEDATGRYVFAIPQDQRDDVRVVASYTGDVAAVAFTGAVR